MAKMCKCDGWGFDCLGTIPESKAIKFAHFKFCERCYDTLYCVADVNGFDIYELEQGCKRGEGWALHNTLVFTQD